MANREDKAVPETAPSTPPKDIGEVAGIEAAEAQKVYKILRDVEDAIRNHERAVVVDDDRANSRRWHIAVYDATLTLHGAIEDLARRATATPSQSHSSTLIERVRVLEDVLTRARKYVEVWISYNYGDPIGPTMLKEIDAALSSNTEAR